jgi:hypothetical protein
MDVECNWHCGLGLTDAMDPEIAALVSSGTHRVTRAQIRGLAAALSISDRKCFDVRAARAAGLPDLLAPPGFIAVYAAPVFRALLHDLRLGVDRARTVHGEQEFSFGADVLAGDLISTDARLLSHDAGGRHRVLVFGTTSINQRGEMVARGEWTVFVRGH